MKKTVRLTESDLKKIIKESVSMILKREKLEECVKRSLKESLSNLQLMNEKKDDSNKKRSILQWLRQPEVNSAEIRRQLEGNPESQKEEDAKRSYFMKKVNQTNDKDFTDE